MEFLLSLFNFILNDEGKFSNYTGIDIGKKREKGDIMSTYQCDIISIE